MISHLSTRHYQPRRARRGLSALTTVLFLSSVLAIVASVWQIDVARARIEGEVRHLGEVVASEGYGLHHWLHANPPTTPPCGGSAPCGRALSSPEQIQLAGAATVAPWRRGADDTERVVIARGWEIDHLFANTGDEKPDGVIVLRPDTTNCLRNVPPGDQLPTWKGTRAALDNALGTGGDAAETVATNALGNSFDPACDSAVLASRFARIDTQAMLREPHAGHPVLPMEADFIARGTLDDPNDPTDDDNPPIKDVAHLIADRAAHSMENETLILNEMGGPLMADALTVPACDSDDPDDDCSLKLEGNFIAQDVVLNHATFSPKAAGGITVTDSLRVGIDPTTGFPTNNGTVTISGATIANELTACTNPDEDLCGGGDLTASMIEDDHPPAKVRVFGIATIEGAAVTSTAARANAGTGVFDEVEATNLNVSNCFRSVNPYVYGARCPTP